MADWIFREPDITRYLFRKTAGYTNPEECIHSLDAAIRHLCRIAGEDIDRDYRERFESRLKQVSE